MKGTLMHVGRIFRREGTYWFVEKIILEHNRRFRWKKVVCSWSWLGPRPLWAADKRIFFVDRKVL